MTQSTYTVLSARLGAAASGAVELIGANQIVDALWQNPAAWGIVPFDELVPRLRALDIDGRSPLRRNLDLNAYPLSVEIVLSGNLEAAAKFQAAFGDPLTNRDESRMTILAMTGVTAMSRDFAAEMDAKGVQYPVELIQDWFTTSDIVHISNEVSFDEDCPKQPTPNRSIFCSNPSYLDLLKESNVKIVELTGNHLNDYGWEPLSYTLSLYDQAGIPYFGGGRTITDGIKAVTLKDHGNTIAFVGCNPVGPPIDWIDGLNDGRPGSVPCASPFQAMQDQIKEAREAGAVVVATLQYYEQPLGDYSYKTAAVQADDFALLADAGAAIVSGSQGHSVQGFGLRGDSFIHYGVGNLYFDQMQALNLRQNFIDRYLIYTGRLLSVELLTTIRDEPARLRPMTPAERGELLKTLFELSNWGK
jgi:poly-gamma-glutamate synthesis protein (capsule biosynthesis protein)